MTKETLLYDVSFTRNRELSWLKFNQRVLEEAADDSVPLYERLKFVSIFTSNLDEFFMIRVGSLYDLALMDEENSDSRHIDNKSGMTACEQINEIMKAVEPLYHQRDELLFKTEDKLKTYGINRLVPDKLQAYEEKYIKDYFNTYILPILSPQIIDLSHPFPHLENKALYIVVNIKTKNNSRFGIIPVPKSVPRIVYMQGNLRYILVEDIISHYSESLFDMYSITEKMIVSVTRNADITPEDESFGFEEDYRIHMKKLLKKRARLAAVRIEIQGLSSSSTANYLCEKLNIGKNHVFWCKSPLDLSYVYALEEKINSANKRFLLYNPFEPQALPDINPKENIIKYVLKRDLFLSYPYNSMEPFLRLIKEASTDPSVISIKITLYRIDKKSKLAEYLIDAAEQNKEVTVIMELRARFDEENNIDWSGRLEEAGCRVIYGFEEYKIHSKICLITRHEKNRYQYITQIGTGNFNEKTSKLYADYSLITANEEIGSDANNFFKNISVSNIEGNYNHLLVAPNSFKRIILFLIDNEIQKQKDGKASSILFKLNSLTDRDILDKLSAASQAGVRINLIIRGICCIIPGILGKTENITVTSIVGRFLEHARVYCFGAGNDALVYISSADMMTRNTERRIEIACPILDADIKEKIFRMLELQLKDNVKARILGSGGDYAYKKTPANETINSQELFMEEAMKRYNSFSDKNISVFSKLWTLIDSYYKNRHNTDYYEM